MEFRILFQQDVKQVQYHEIVDQWSKLIKTKRVCENCNVMILSSFLLLTLI